MLSVMVRSSSGIRVATSSIWDDSDAHVIHKKMPRIAASAAPSVAVARERRHPRFSIQSTTGSSVNANTTATMNQRTSL